MKQTIIPYNPRLKEYARFLRRNATPAEIRLWKSLRGGQILGRDFDRQRPIGEYIVDFYCKELRLAIEVDGSSHNDKPEADAKRQRALESFGVGFLRFWEHEIRDDVASVVTRIEAWIRTNATHPQPLQGGERMGADPHPTAPEGRRIKTNPPPAPPGRGEE